MIWSLKYSNTLYAITYIQNFTTNNQPCFVQGIIGERTAIRLSSISQQYVTIDYLYDFRNVSFSVTSWIYPYNLQQWYRPIFAQCSNQTQLNCLYLRISNRKMEAGFFVNDTTGSTNLNINCWYHVAFVYDYTSQTSIVYLNGLQDGIGMLPGYQGVPFNITIGRANAISGTYFDGLIDRISIVNRKMTADEVLQEATLSAYYSFDNSIEIDSGPNQINGSGYNVALTDGVSGQSLQFFAESNSSYFQIRSFPLLGISNSSYSFSFWIRTNQTHSNGSIIYMTSENDWCLPTLGFNSHGDLIAQTSDGTSRVITGPPLNDSIWTHIVLTYASGDELKIYLNGSLQASNGPLDYVASESPVTLTLGYLESQENCTSNYIIPGPFVGAIDEFRIYSRCLNESDIQTIMQLDIQTTTQSSTPQTPRVNPPPALPGSG